MTHSLRITNLQIETLDGKKILHGISLNIYAGEIHAILGPNGSGKSTLAQTIMGSPQYKVVSGKIKLNGKNLLTLSPNKKAGQGLFLGFQYPVEVEGVNLSNFLRLAFDNNKTDQDKLSVLSFLKLLAEEGNKLGLNEEILRRNLNEGFSGGERKKLEILQMALLKPRFAILDEPDSGLDVDGVRQIAKAIKSLDYPLGLILITHHQRILYYIKPDYVHILIKGKIVKTGDFKLARKVERKGYRFTSYD